ncbi:hypothetical protein C8A03DRAFT_14815, partial [Achaetomium macrosporum]
YVAFIPLQDQVNHLVNHLIALGTDWGRMYTEAVQGRFLAEHGSIHERWYDAIVSELVWRGKYSFFLFILNLAVSFQHRHLSIVVAVPSLSFFHQTHPIRRVPSHPPLDSPSDSPPDSPPLIMFFHQTPWISGVPSFIAFFLIIPSFSPLYSVHPHCSAFALLFSSRICQPS